MKNAAFFALALGCLSLAAQAQAPDAADDETRIRNAAERVQKSGVSTEGGVSQPEKESIERLKSAGMNNAAVESLSKAANAAEGAASTAPARRETFEERPVAAETPREPPETPKETAKADDAADGEKRPSDTSEPKKDADAAEGGKETAESKDDEPGKDTASADEKTGVAKDEPAPETGAQEAGAPNVEPRGPGGPTILVVPHGRSIASRDPKIRTAGEHTVEQPLDTAGGFPSLADKAVSIAVLQPPAKSRPFGKAEPSAAAAGFAPLPVRTATVAALPRTEAGFEAVKPRGVDRARPPQPRTSAMPTLLETP